MKTRFAFPHGRIMSAKTRRWGRGYTLVEMLFVIVIISVLSSLIASQVIKILDDGNRLKTRALVLELKQSIASFWTDYGRLPLADAKDDQEWFTDGSNPIVDSVLGLPAETGAVNLNPRGTKFANFPPAKNQRHGLLNESRPLKLHDMWGRPLRVILDADGDHQVPNPDALSSDPTIALPGGKPVSPFLILDMVIYSCGKDGLPHTADDVVSWRTP